MGNKHMKMSNIFGHQGNINQIKRDSISAATQSLSSRMQIPRAGTEAGLREGDLDTVGGNAN